MVKHEYSVITGSSYTCDLLKKKEVLINGFRTEPKNRNNEKKGKSR